MKLKLFLGNVRVVLFRECDKKGKKLLFDSSTVEKVRLSPQRENKEAIFTESTDGWGYKYLQPPSKDVRYTYQIINVTLILFMIQAFE